MSVSLKYYGNTLENIWQQIWNYGFNQHAADLAHNNNGWKAFYMLNTTYKTRTLQNKMLFSKLGEVTQDAWVLEDGQVGYVSYWLNWKHAWSTCVCFWPFVQCDGLFSHRSVLYPHAPCHQFSTIAQEPSSTVQILSNKQSTIGW